MYIYIYCTEVGCVALANNLYKSYHCILNRNGIVLTKQKKCILIVLIEESEQVQNQTGTKSTRIIISDNILTEAFCDFNLIDLFVVYCASCTIMFHYAKVIFNSPFG
jgi:hypothetical protein